MANDRCGVGSALKAVRGACIGRVTALPVAIGAAAASCWMLWRAKRASRIGRADRGVDRAAGQELELARHGLAGERVLDLGIGCAGLGREVEQHLGQAGAGHPVDERVVHLLEQGDPAVLQPLDDPRLPERLLAVELVAGQAADELAELAVVAGLGDADAADVVVDVELVVLGPARPVEAEGDVDELVAQLGHLGDAGDQQVDEAVERPAVGMGGGVDDDQPRHVHVPVGRLAVQERGVLAGHLSHG